MNRRIVMLGAGVGALVLLNLWQWWPRTAEQTRVAVAPSGGTRPEDFRLRMEAAPQVDATAPGRDLFQPKRPPAPAVARSKASAPPPPKSPEELEREAAQAELAQYRCVGVSVRAGRIQAFVVRGDQSFLVSPGGRVGDRFVVDKITPEAISLSDPRTGVAGQISVSGK